VSWRFNLTAMALWLLSSCANNQQTSKLKYVNPYIGSEGHGHVFVGANVPFGAVQLGPSQIMQHWDEYSGWDWCSGYNYKSKEILGFTHTHLSGTGIGDLNDILVLPATGKVQLKPMEFEKQDSGYGSYFSRSKEKVEPGYYEVYLDKYGVRAQLTATERVGLHKYDFDKTDNAHLLIDLKFGMGWDSPTETSLKQINDSTFVGHRNSTGWSKDQRVFFALKTSVPVKYFEMYEDTVGQSGSEALGKATKAVLYTGDNRQVLLKVAISPVSTENALLNMNTELPHWDFEKVKAQAQNKWESVFNKVEIDASDSVKTVFYTALYHTHIAPSLFNDVNGDYRGSDKKVYKNADFQNYTTFSLWDTYRGLNPLMTVIQPDKVNDFVTSLVRITEQQDALAMWPLQGSETFCMIGNPAMTVISDAYLKGLVKEDIAIQAFMAINKVANHPTEDNLPIGQKWVSELKWIPADNRFETVAWGMEYAIADDAFSKMAKAMGKTKEADYYAKRGKLYKEYFDAKVGFFNGRFADGNFRKDFDPFYADHRTNDYVEGNAWQYLWMVPHQPHSLIEMLGGDDAFSKRLDEFFTLPTQLSKTASNDITGLMGQYAHGNEPSHHTAYLYTFAGKQWKTAEIIRNVTDKFYTTQPDGLIGNEDVGQMSAWYVLSSLGFYSANPASGQFVFGSPIIHSGSIKVAKDKAFKVVAKNNSAENKYIQSVSLNGKTYSKSFIAYTDIMKGGELIFTMGSQPNKSFGTDKAVRPE
jgi:predicted alpha-1,2-mannosidase